MDQEESEKGEKEEDAPVVSVPTSKDSNRGLYKALAKLFDIPNTTGSNLGSKVGLTWDGEGCDRVEDDDGICDHSSNPDMARNAMRHLVYMIMNSIGLLAYVIIVLLSLGGIFPLAYRESYDYYTFTPNHHALPNLFSPEKSLSFIDVTFYLAILMEAGFVIAVYFGGGEVAAERGGKKAKLTISKFSSFANTPIDFITYLILCGAIVCWYCKVPWGSFGCFLLALIINLFAYHFWMPWGSAQKTGDAGHLTLVEFVFIDLTDKVINNWLIFRVFWSFFAGLKSDGNIDAGWDQDSIASIIVGLSVIVAIFYNMWRKDAAFLLLFAISLVLLGRQQESSGSEISFVICYAGAFAISAPAIIFGIQQASRFMIRRDLTKVIRNRGSNAPPPAYSVQDAD